jgi:hypothetical protein
MRSGGWREVLESHRLRAGPGAVQHSRSAARSNRQPSAHMEGSVRVPRGMGALCADYGPIPAGYLCSDAGGSATLTKVGAGPSTVVNVSPSGVNTIQDFPSDTPLSCADMAAAGVDLSGTTCASSMPGWVIPAAVGVLMFALFMGSRGR